MKFTCDFNVVGLTVIGRFSDRNATKPDFPKLQIWTRKAHEDSPGIKLYYQVDSRETMLKEKKHTACQLEPKINETVVENVSQDDTPSRETFRCILRFQMNKQLSVNSGDILGLQLPATKNSNVFEIHFKDSMPLKKMIYFEWNSSTTNNPYNINISSNSTSLLAHQQPLIKLMLPCKDKSGMFVQ